MRGKPSARALEAFFIWYSVNTYSCMRQCVSLTPLRQWRGVGGGGLKNVYTGRLRPYVQPLSLLYTISHTKVPLLYTLY